MRVQRIMSAGHGGPVLLSQSSAELMRGELPSWVIPRGLGEHRRPRKVEASDVVNTPGFPQGNETIPPICVPITVGDDAGRAIAVYKHIAISQRMVLKGNHEVLQDTGLAGVSRTGPILFGLANTVIRRRRENVMKHG